MIEEGISRQQQYESVYSHEGSLSRSISDRQLMQLIACHGFQERFGIQDVHLSKEEVRFSEINDAWYLEKRGVIRDRSGQQFTLSLVRDLDNAGIKIRDTDGSTILYVNLRDRHNDGTAEASSPTYLRESMGITQIPDRANYLGGTNWNYSMPVDRQSSGRNSLEISIVSSDPTKRTQPRLEAKDRQLWVKAHELAQFIDDPFAAIPFDHPTPEALSKWYQMWWQVVNRGLRGKKIPFPGQVSEQGFGGFLSHVVKTTSTLASELGYTHISAVPTWMYVLHMFQDRGFTFDDSSIERQTESFLTSLDSICIPIPGRRDHISRLGNVSNKDPLRSWFAILPYVLRLNTDITPSLGIPATHQEEFDKVLQQAKNAFVLDRGVISYPLEPDNNIWLSKTV